MRCSSGVSITCVVFEKGRNMGEESKKVHKMKILRNICLWRHLPSGPVYLLHT
jgi:hypothetical protein